jgi:hypothetical protein
MGYCEHRKKKDNSKNSFIVCSSKALYDKYLYEPVYIMGPRGLGPCM